MNYPFARFPFVRYVSALAIGILLGQSINISLDYTFGAIGLFTIIYFIIYAIGIGGNRTFLGLIGLMLLFLIGYTSSQSLKIKEQKVVENIENQPLSRIIKIESIVEEKANSWKAICKDEASSIEILTYLNKEKIPKPKYGDRFFVKAKLQKVPAPLNPFEFDYQRYMAQGGVYCQVYVTDTTSIYLGNMPSNTLLNWAYKLNRKGTEILEKNIADKQSMAILKAMILGVRDEVDYELMSAYSAAGAIHVLSVSGLHVGVIMTVLSSLLAFLKKSKNGKYYFLAIVVSILWFYAFLTGLSAPVLRSTIMFSIILLAKTIRRQHNSYNTLAISAILILLIWPLIIYNIGFQLSYLAVLGMIMIQPLLNQLVTIDKHENWLYWALDRLWKISTVAIAAQIATLPITIFYFHQFPNYFLLANPIVIILSSIALIYGLAYLFLSAILAYLNWHILDTVLGKILEAVVLLLNKTVFWFENLPGAVSSFLHFSILELILSYALIISILYFILFKKSIGLQAAIGFSVMFIFTQYYAIRKSKNNDFAYILATPKQTALTSIKGRSTTLYADADFLASHKNVSFRLMNLWVKKGVKDSTLVTLPNKNKVLMLKNRTVLLIKERLLPINEPFDYILVANKKISYTKDIKNKLRSKYLILDGHFTKFYADRFIKEAASDSKKAYWLLETGAIQIQ